VLYARTLPPDISRQDPRRPRGRRVWRYLHRLSRRRLPRPHLVDRKICCMDGCWAGACMHHSDATSDTCLRVHYKHIHTIMNTHIHHNMCTHIRCTHNYAFMFVHGRIFTCICIKTHMKAMKSSSFFYKPRTPEAPKSCRLQHCWHMPYEQHFDRARHAHFRAIKTFA
jgi:hypothetical protein